MADLQQGFDFDAPYPELAHEQDNAIVAQHVNPLNNHQIDQQINPPVSWVKGFLSAKQQQLLLNEVAHYPLEKVAIEVYGKQHLIPRTQAWFGDVGCDYHYSKLHISALPWPKVLSRLRLKLLSDHQIQSNSVLVNRYADGRDCMGWHSDDEPEIVTNSAIASVTLGACRDFIVRHKETQTKVKYALESGDLLIMHPGMQQHWQHALPKRLKVTEPRINFTFRHIIPHYYR